MKITPLVVIALALLYINTVAAIAVPIMYHLLTHGAWRDTPIGKHMMSMSVCIAVMLLFTSIAPLLPATASIVAAIILYPLLTALLLNQIRLIVKSHRGSKHDAPTHG